MENNKPPEDIVTLITREGAWRVVAVQQGLSPVELLNATSVRTIAPKAKEQLKSDLAHYRTEVEQFVDAVIANGIPGIDREKQIEILWNSPVMYKEELTYEKK